MQCDLSDLSDLPDKSHATYLYTTVTFHLQELALLIDDRKFSEFLNQFYENPQTVAQEQQTGLILYLLVMAFGKALLNHSRSQKGPPGHQYAARALALMPDFTKLHEDHLLAIEVLALAALYLQSIDLRIAAFQYVSVNCTKREFSVLLTIIKIGQALRFCYVEGLHRDALDGIVNPALSERCRAVWWIVYILDRELTALMGSPSSISDDAITAALPQTKDKPALSTVIELQVRLSALIARTCNSKITEQRNCRKLD